MTEEQELDLVLEELVETDTKLEETLVEEVAETIEEQEKQENLLADEAEALLEEVLQQEDDELLASSSSEPVAAISASKATWVNKATAAEIADLWKSLAKKKKQKPPPEEIEIVEPV